MNVLNSWSILILQIRGKSDSTKTIAGDLDLSQSKLVYSP